MVVCVKFSAPPPAGLTKEQVWAGLLIKATEGAALVPMIAETEIISKRKDGVTRKTTLKDGKVLHKITTLRKSRLSVRRLSNCSLL